MAVNDPTAPISTKQSWFLKKLGGEIIVDMTKGQASQERMEAMAHPA